MTTNQTTSLESDPTIAELLALIPIALEAANLRPGDYPVSAREGKRGLELDVRNPVGRVIRQILTDGNGKFSLLIEQPPYGAGVQTFKLYGGKPNKVEAERLCGYLLHSLRPIIEGDINMNRAAVIEVVLAAIAKHREQDRATSRCA